MAGISTNVPLVLVEARRGLEIETYRDHLHLVRSVINSGRLGGGNTFGDSQHAAALKEVEKQIADTRASIADPEPASPD